MSILNLIDPYDRADREELVSELAPLRRVPIGGYNDCGCGVCLGVDPIKARFTETIDRHHQRYDCRYCHEIIVFTHFASREVVAAELGLHRCKEDDE